MIPSRLLSLLLLFSVSVLVSCQKQIDWIVFRGENGSGYTSNTLFPPLGLRWKLKLQEQTKDAKAFNPPVIKGDIIYFGADDGNFYALDMTSGYMRWIFKTRAPVNSVPYADDDKVYFGSNDGSVYAVGIEDGKQQWVFPTGNTVQSLIARYNDRIIFTSDTGNTYFLSLDGKEMDRLPNPVWSHHTFQVYENVVYWAPLGRKFGAYDIDKMDFLWTVDVTVPYAVWYSFPALDDKYVYYSSSFFKEGPIEFNYYALDRLTGESVWEHKEDFHATEAMSRTGDMTFMRHVQLLDYLAPALWKDYVIYASGDSIVRAFDNESGDIAWSKDLGYATSSAPTIAGDRVYLGLYGDEEGGQEKSKLVALSASDGSVIWEMETEGAVLSAPVISGKRMFFGTSKNYFYVLEEVF